MGKVASGGQENGGMAGQGGLVDPNLVNGQSSVGEGLGCSDWRPKKKLQAGQWAAPPPCVVGLGTGKGGPEDPFRGDRNSRRYFRGDFQVGPKSGQTKFTEEAASDGGGDKWISSIFVSCQLLALKYTYIFEMKTAVYFCSHPKAALSRRKQ